MQGTCTHMLLQGQTMAAPYVDLVCSSVCGQTHWLAKTCSPSHALHQLTIPLLCMLTLLVAVQLSQRFWNSHAMINMSVWLRTEQPSLASALSRKLGINVAAEPCLTQVRVVIGSPRQELGGMLPCICFYCFDHAKVCVAPRFCKVTCPYVVIFACTCSFCCFFS